MRQVAAIPSQAVAITVPQIVTAKRAKKRRTDDGLSEPVRKLVR